MPTDPAKKLLPMRIVVLVLATACVSMLLFWFIHPGAPPSVLPSPNGYGDFQKAIGVYREPTPDVSNADLEELRTHLEKNREALRLVRLGLARPCRVPVQYTEAYRDRMMQELSGLKGLALSLKAEGKAAEEDNRLGDAVNSYLDTIRFGQESVGGCWFRSWLDWRAKPSGCNHWNSCERASAPKTAKSRQDVGGH
jgi:hypothetical protein